MNTAPKSRTFDRFSPGIILLAIVLLGAGLLALASRPIRATEHLSARTASSAPATGFWTTMPSFGPIGHNAAVVLNGMLYSFGGLAEGGGITAMVWRYDIAQNTWTMLDSLPALRYGLEAATDGQFIYLYGGEDSSGAQSTLWRFDPSTGGYTTLSEGLSQAASRAGWLYLPSTHELYRIGGDTNFAGGTFLNSVQAYNTVSGTWSTRASYPLAASGLSVMTANGYIYAAGGRTATGATSKTFRYDPVANTWDDASISDLGQPRQGAFSALINGQWILQGGYDSSGLTTSGVAWTVAVNSNWAVTAVSLAVPKAYGGNAQTFLNGGTAWFAVGGMTPTGPTSDAEQYLDGVITPTPTSTVTPVPTSTSTPGPAVLVGHVTWQGRPAQPNVGQQLPITLTLKSAGAEVNYPIQLTDPSGFFTVTVTGLAGGSYNWRARGYSFLATSGTVLLSGAPTTQVEMGLQRAGDVNGDNVINGTDFTQMKNNFGQGGAHPIQPGGTAP